MEGEELSKVLQEKEEQIKQLMEEGGPICNPR